MELAHFASILFEGLPIEPYMYRKSSISRRSHVKVVVLTQ